MIREILVKAPVSINVNITKYLDRRYTPGTPALRGPKQENSELEASLSYTDSVSMI